MLMNEIFDRYERDRVPLLGERTRRDCVRYHLPVLRRHFGGLDADAIKPRDIGRFLDVPKGKIWRNKIANTLSAVFTCAVGRWFYCDINPCLKVVRHESKPRNRYVTDAEFQAVYQLAGFHVRLAMDLALLTGQRQGDLLDLKWAEVHETYIDIVQAKTGKHLGIKITPALEAVLLRARQRPPDLPKVYVVRTRMGRPFSHGGFRMKWQTTMAEALRKGAIKERFTFHDLRAKCASDKESLEGASQLLGHQGQGMTKRVYDRKIRMVEPLR
jgi:integrase